MSDQSADTMAWFDIATMPLRGVRLVEASAGTGKTFSLTGLYLRLIIEHDADVRDILVVTFTRAATQELRERLRERLLHAAEVAMTPPSAEASEPGERLAETLIAAASAPRMELAARLRDAATRMDQATIATLHGFAQRAVAENAFDSALPFDRGDPVDDREIHLEATTDYWRERVFNVPAPQARAFLTLWRQPETLHGQLREALQAPHARLAGPDREQVIAQADAARKAWTRDRAALGELLELARTEDCLRKHCALRKRLDADGVEGLLAAIDEGLGGTRDGIPVLPGFLADLGTDAGVLAHAKKAWAARFRPQDLAGVREMAALQPAAYQFAAREAVDAIRALAQRRKRERHLFSFNDMITALHDALYADDHGQPLARALHRTWPWLLVDEFQDTDPLQYAILQAIHRGGGDDGGMVLIGDPKQSIYSFRGGDVFAWLAAARDADGRYGMETNYRSTASVLRGIEGLFSAAGRDAFVLPDIGFNRVHAGRRDGDSRIVRDAGEVAGVTAWYVPAEAGSGKNAVANAIQAATVARIGSLLAEARLRTDDGDERPIAAGDVAVLVNTNREASAMQSALRAAGVPAVCHQHDSVLRAPAATDLLRVLRAMASPLDPALLRVALITPLFGYTLADLLALDTDEEAWIAATERFQQAHVEWTRRGVQAVLEPLIQASAARVLAQADGERRTTDYLHLADLLQQAERQVFGLHGLADWLEDAMARADDGETGDADRLRLADDSALVQITTVHRAKGLEYPVVFVPYAPWLATGGEDPGAPPLRFHDADAQAVIDLHRQAPAEHRIAAIRERRAEGVRLLYVALTRARQAVYFTHAAANGSADGPLAWLLHRGDGLEPEIWHGSRGLPDWLTASRVQQRLEQAAAGSGGALAVEPLPLGDAVTGVRTEDPARAAQNRIIGPARDDLPTPRPDWSVFSFSRLAGGLARASGATAGGTDETASEPAVADPEAPEVIIHPRGMAFGQVVHELLEATDFTTWPQPGNGPDEAAGERIAAALRRHGIATTDTGGDSGPVERTAELLASTLHAPLPGLGPLATLPRERRRAEMEFLLPLAGTPARDFLGDIAAAGYAGATGAGADAHLRGLMHGFIDLVVEHEGRYWVLDYKTNLLGNRRADYAPEALAGVMATHHYDLQYLIYLLALHRHLRLHIPGYEAARHLGGALYLFVRGLDRTGDHGIHCDRPDPALIERLDRRLAAEGVTA